MKILSDAMELRQLIPRRKQDKVSNQHNLLAPTHHTKLAWREKSLAIIASPAIVAGKKKRKTNEKPFPPKLTRVNEPGAEPNLGRGKCPHIHTIARVTS